MSEEKKKTPLQLRQEEYLADLMENIDQVLTMDQRENKYCLIFGDQVIGEYTTAEAAAAAQATEFKNIMSVLWVPPLKESNARD